MKATFRLLQPVDFTPEIQDEVLSLGISSRLWQESDIEYFRNQFKNPKNINIVYQREKIVGYILARPHNEAAEDYLVEDPLMVKNDLPMFYIEHVNVDKSELGNSLGMKLIFKVIKEANRQGVYWFSWHGRVSTGFSRIMQKKFFGHIRSIRRIERYIDGNNEPYDYCEGKLVLEK